jgi:dienelactone hydrolase
MRPEWSVLYGHQEYSKADSMLHEYFSKLRTRADKRIPTIRTAEALQAYQAETAASLKAILGEFPARTPLNAKTVGRLDRAGYAVEKVIFESRPRYYVTANVYVPRPANGPYPALLCPVGHWGAGKFFEDMQRLGAYLARRGFVVLVYDSAGQGERQQYWDPVMSRTLLSPGTSTWFVTIEHGYAGGQTILARDNYAAYLVWDGIRGLDYLAARPDVDPGKLACSGTSGGGLQTELLSAIDPRIKVSIPVCYGGCAPDTPARRGLSMTDVDALIAPRAEVEQRIALNHADSPLDAHTLDREGHDSYTFEKLVYYSEPEVYIPAVLFLPKSSQAAPAVVFVSDAGKTGPGVVDSYLRPLAESGVAVLAIDPRGTGETAPAHNPESSYRYFTADNESRFLYDALGAGATPLGMRTRDVLRAIDYLRSRPGIDSARISVIGQGSAGLAALHAAALDDKVRSAAISGTLVSYAAIVDNEIYTHRYSWFTPGVLRKYDLPDVAALVAPRPLVVINAVDHMQRPLEPERAAESYASTAKIFDLAGAGASFRSVSAGSAAEILEQYRAVFQTPKR